MLQPYQNCKNREKKGEDLQGENILLEEENGKNLMKTLNSRKIKIYIIM